MRLATIEKDRTEMAAIVDGERLLPIASINEVLKMDWPISLFDLIDTGKVSH
ncbi:hypothetical protein SAMN05421743_103159 [Thalassobacillus cyri]|uniref:Uncharacterized protein n=1 Tax=Thalassobacillus cyri TaxID=571932 RepID=A0A1H3Z977_9BACI|nr:hypothetical protein SAMN05421743_103159 [Thalassobacillus cyri]